MAILQWLPQLFDTRTRVLKGVCSALTARVPGHPARLPVQAFPAQCTAWSAWDKALLGILFPQLPGHSSLLVDSAVQQAVSLSACIARLAAGHSRQCVT